MSKKLTDKEKIEALLVKTLACHSLGDVYRCFETIEGAWSTAARNPDDFRWFLKRTSIIYALRLKKGYAPSTLKRKRTEFMKFWSILCSLTVPIEAKTAAILKRYPSPPLVSQVRSAPWDWYWNLWN